MRKRVLLITGAPGIGKTTVVTKIMDTLVKDMAVGGMISREAREGGIRTGFEIIDLTHGKKGWLAHVNQQIGPQVGKYRVNLQDLDNIGALAIAQALETCEVIIIDEIGPMELFSEKFKQGVEQALRSEKLVVAVVHAKAKDPLINEAKQRADAETFAVTLANRDRLSEEVIKKALSGC